MKIAGINEAAMGQLDQTAISGRALLARQRQAVIGKEGFMANFHRSKELCGRKLMELVQGHYTEERIIRVRGAGNDPVQKIINQRTAAGIVNDVTLGSYSLAIDETPLSKTFLEAQFEELMRMKETGMPIPDEFIIENSNLINKTGMVAKMKEAAQTPEAEMQHKMQVMGQQLELSELKGKIAKEEADAVLKRAKAAKEVANTQEVLNGPPGVEQEMELERQKAEQDMQLQREKHEQDMQMQREKAQLEAEIKMQQSREDARLKRAQAIMAARQQPAGDSPANKEKTAA
jgi:hypothetical protein